jgi:hypothetical protein
MEKMMMMMMIWSCVQCFFLRQILASWRQKKSEGANECFLFGEISPNFDLKNMTSPYAKDFSWKK